MLRIVQNPISLDLVQRVAEEFGYQPSSASGLPHPDTFIVDIRNRTPSTERLFIKAKPFSQKAEVELCQALQATQMMVTPRFRRAKDGSYSPDIEGFYWTCQNYYPSETSYIWLDFNCSNIHCSKAGETLGLLHTRSTSIAEQFYSDARIETLEHLILETPRRLRIAFSKAQSKLLSSDIVGQEQIGSAEVPEDALQSLRALNLRANDIQLRTQALCAELSRIEQQSKLVINHGDYHPGNLIFSAGGISLVCDWEYACAGSSLYDLSYALYLFSFEFPKSPNAPPLNNKRMESFLDGYSRNARVNSSRMRLLDKYMEYVQIVMMAWLLEQFVSKTSYIPDQQKYWRFFTTFLDLCAK